MFEFGGKLYRPNWDVIANGQTMLTVAASHPSILAILPSYSPKETVLNSAHISSQSFHTL